MRQCRLRHAIPPSISSIPASGCNACPVSVANERPWQKLTTPTIDGFALQGFDWIWLLSVWRTGPAGRAVSRSKPEWRAEFSAVLPDLEEDDIYGSGFAITAYTVSDEIGGDAALALFRERLAQRVRNEAL